MAAANPQSRSIHRGLENCRHQFHRANSGHIPGLTKIQKVSPIAMPIDPPNLQSLLPSHTSSTTGCVPAGMTAHQAAFQGQQQIQQHIQQPVQQHQLEPALMAGPYSGTFFPTSDHVIGVSSQCMEGSLTNGIGAGVSGGRDSHWPKPHQNHVEHIGKLTHFQPHLYL